MALDELELPLEIGADEHAEQSQFLVRALRIRDLFHIVHAAAHQPSGVAGAGHARGARVAAAYVRAHRATLAPVVHRGIRVFVGRSVVEVVALVLVGVRRRDVGMQAQGCTVVPASHQFRRQPVGAHVQARRLGNQEILKTAGILRQHANGAEAAVGGQRRGQCAQRRAAVDVPVGCAEDEFTCAGRRLEIHFCTRHGACDGNARIGDSVGITEPALSIVIGGIVPGEQVQATTGQRADKGLGGSVEVGLGAGLVVQRDHHMNTLFLAGSAQPPVLGRILADIEVVAGAFHRTLFERFGEQGPPAVADLERHHAGVREADVHHQFRLGPDAPDLGGHQFQHFARRTRIGSRLVGQPGAGPGCIDHTEQEMGGMLRAVAPQDVALDIIQLDRGRPTIGFRSRQIVARADDVEHGPLRVGGV